MRSAQHHFLGKPEGAAWQVPVWCRGLRVAVPGQAERGPSCAKAWWQLSREEPKKERSRVKYSFGCPSQIPAASSNVFSNAQHKSPSLGSFCFALRVNLLVWARDRSPAPCLSFPIWAEGLVWVCFCSGVQWRQVQSSTLKSSDEKRWRRTEAY